LNHFQPKMSVEMDEDDDFYAPEEPTVAAPAQQAAAPAPTAEKPAAVKPEDEDLEEGEEEDEGGAMDEDEDNSVRSAARLCNRMNPLPEDAILINLLVAAQDIDIITERKDGSKPAPPSLVP
jgi:pre-mRNA 3'-end-processing factor FIP1